MTGNGKTTTYIYICGDYIIYIYIFYGDLGDGFVTFFYPHDWGTQTMNASKGTPVEPKKTGKDPAAIPGLSPQMSC